MSRLMPRPPATSSGFAVAWHIARKDLRLLSRDRAGLFWVLGFPLLFGLFFGFLTGGGGGRRSLPLAVVDEDHSPAAQDFISRLRASDALRLEDAPLDSATERVRKGELVAYLRLQPGFGAAAKSFPPRLSGLEVGIDPMRRAERGVLGGLIAQAFFAPEREAMLRAAPRGSGAGEAGGDAPSFVDVTRREAGPTSPFEVTFPSAVMWGMIGCISTFAISLVNERNEGTLLRLRLAPVGGSQVLAGKALACLCACTGVATLLLVVGRLLFRIRIQSLGLLALGVLATAACFTGLMMMVSTFGRTTRAVSGAGWALFMIMSMLGGGMIPLIAMPDWMQAVSSASPVKWGILSLEGAIWRGFSGREMLLPYVVLMTVGAVAFAIGRARLPRVEA